jgi:hypothetical protein
MMQEEQQLRVPIIGRQRPAVAKHDRLARTPALGLGSSSGRSNDLVAAGCAALCRNCAPTQAGVIAAQRRSPAKRVSTIG